MPMMEQYAYQVLQLALHYPEWIWELYQAHRKGYITNQELWEEIDDRLTLSGILINL
jgi:hypothetical protein